MNASSSSPRSNLSPSPRIAVTCNGNPADLGVYSGGPASLLEALGEIGIESLPLRGDLGPRGQVQFERILLALRLRPSDLLHPGVLRQTRRQLRSEVALSRPMSTARTRAVAFRSARLGPLSGIFQYGVGFDLPPGTPAVTLEDATFHQVCEDYRWPWLRNLSGSRRTSLDEQTRRRYARAEACAFMSSWAAASAIRDYRVPASKVCVVGVGRNHNPPCPADRDWSRPRALFVGLDWERKNGPAVLRAFSKLREQRADARLDIVGGHPRLDVEGVRAHGQLSLTDPTQRSRLEALFGAATFFVMPSLHEPAGIVYAEAQAAGIASIATTSGGAATIVGDAGIVVDPHDDRALSDAMSQLAEPECAARLGDLARRRARLFTWRAVAERLLRALAPPGLDLAPLADFLTDDTDLSIDADGTASLDRVDARTGTTPAKPPRKYDPHNGTQAVARGDL
jgi:glycosyltransferase involved in cell wall biosynthesis